MLSRTPVYNRRDQSGSLDDIRPGDWVEFFSKGGGQIGRYCRSAHPSYIVTEPLTVVIGSEEHVLDKGGTKVSHQHIVEVVRSSGGSPPIPTTY